MLKFKELKLIVFGVRTSDFSSYCYLLVIIHVCSWMYVLRTLSNVRVFFLFSFKRKIAVLPVRTLMLDPSVPRRTAESLFDYYNESLESSLMANPCPHACHAPFLNLKVENWNIIVCGVFHGPPFHSCSLPTAVRILQTIWLPFLVEHRHQVIQVHQSTPCASRSETSSQTATSFWSCTSNGIKPSIDIETFGR